VNWYWLVCRSAYSSYIQFVNTDIHSMLMLHTCTTDKRILFHWQVYQCVSHLSCWNMMWLMKTNSENKLFIIYFKKLFTYQIVPRTIAPCISIFYSQTLRIHIMKYKKYDICHTFMLYLIFFYFISNARILSTERQTFQEKSSLQFHKLKCNTKTLH
jgi:uncharacterized membrane protein YcfT